jgi:hypothetical protein
MAYHDISWQNNPYKVKYAEGNCSHENAHRYYQDKGRFSRDKVSASKEERIVDEMAEK